MKALRISLVYLTVASIWIVTSDYLLNLWWMQDSTWWANTYKGWLFVAVTTALLFALIRRAIRSIEASELRFRRAISDAPYPIMLHDSRGAVVAVNKAWIETTGYSASEITSVADWAQCAGREHATTDSLRATEAAEIRTKAGQARTWKCSSASLGAQPDGTELFITIATDTTEQRHLEAQLRQSQKMEAIGRLAGGVAHDFNNLVTIIAGHAEILNDAVDTPAAAESVREIEQAAVRAASLTRQLLLFSKRQVARPVTLDVNDSVHAMESMLRRLIGENISLVISLSPETCTVEADPTNIEQVLMNLVVNAREAMPHGGTLAITTAILDAGAVKSPEPETIERIPHVALSVGDAGTGMTPEIAERIFEPFFTTKDTGTGLGLSTVYGIVKQARGHIHVASVPAQGTTVTVFLPRRAHPRTTATSAVERPAQPDTGREVVLVVEDEVAVRDLIVRAVSAAGYTVLQAPDAADAVRVSDEHTGNIDLLITDMAMPGDSGARLADRLKQTRPAVKVIFVSGYHEPLAEEQQSAGCLLIQKPFAPGALVRAVRQVLDGKPQPPGE